ncbi:MAG: hypothetical protein KH289_15375, partial [Bacteroides stercoris]|nr:hypothetical protein [Bacteroides stercoris]
TFAFGLYKGHYTYPMVAQFSTGILAHFSISIYTKYLNKNEKTVLFSIIGPHPTTFRMFLGR